MASKAGSKLVSKRRQRGSRRATNPGWPMKCKLRIKFRSQDVPKVLSAFGVTPEGDREAQERQLGLAFSNVRMSDGWCSVTAKKEEDEFDSEMKRLESAGVRFAGKQTTIWTAPR
jgi:hypothetical protein